MATKPMTEKQRKSALDRGEITAAEYTKLAYEASPYKDSARDNDMRNKLMQSTSKTEGGRSTGRGGATVEELKKYEAKKDANIYTKEKGKPPSPREMAKGGAVMKAAKAPIKKLPMPPTKKAPALAVMTRPAVLAIAVGKPKAKMAKGGAVKKGMK